MAKLSRPLGIAGALDHLNYALHELHHLASSPSLSVMAAGTGLGESTVYRLFCAPMLPTPKVLLPVVAHLAKECFRIDVDDELDRFDAMYRRALAEHMPPPPSYPDRGRDFPDDPPQLAGRKPTGPLPITGGSAMARPAGSPVPARTSSGSAASQRSGTDPGFFVTYAGVDREWVEWVSAELRSLHAMNTELFVRDDLGDALHAVLAGDTAVLAMTGGVARTPAGLHFLTADSEWDDDGRLWNAFSYEDLQLAIAESPARQLVVIIDAFEPDADAAHSWVLFDREADAGYRLELQTPVDRSLFVLWAMRRDLTAPSWMDLIVACLDGAESRGPDITMGELHLRLVRIAQHERLPIPIGIGYNGGFDLTLPRPDHLVRLHSPRIALTCNDSIVSATNDGRLQLWNPDGSLVSEVRSGRTVHALATSPDGYLVLSRSRMDNDAHSSAVFATANSSDRRGDIEQDLLAQTPPDTTALAMSPDGAWLATGHADGSVRIWDASDGSERTRLDGLGTSCLALVVAPSAQLLAAAGSGVVRIWEPSGQGRSIAAPIPTDQACALSYVDGELWVVSATGGRSLWAWNVLNGRAWRCRISGPRWVAAVTMSRDGHIASVDHHGRVTVHSLVGEGWRPVHTE
jgi:WD40 repeat protein